MKDNPDRSGGEDGALENGLPQPFVESMRTLFDILDDQHTGRVRFSDIERRWHEDEDCTTSGLPPGVLESLRVVTPQDGYLSFSRFCKGLQICLLRSKSGNPGLTPTSLASSAQSSPSSGGESSRPSDHQRTSGSRLTGREEVPPPIPPPPSHQAYQAPPPPLPYISHSGSLKNPDFNGNRKVSNHTSAGWLSQKTKSGLPPPPVGLYSGGNVYDMKKSMDGSIYQQHFSLGNNKYHLNGFSHHGEGGRENRNNNVPSSTQIQSSNFPASGNNIRSASSNSPLKNDSKGSSGSSSSSNGEASSNSRSGFGGQVQKSDIRMGTGGMMSVYGGKVASSSNSYSKLHGNASSQGPPKPPRSLESQTSDNLNSASKFNGKPNGSLNQQVSQSSSSHHVDSIINKMEALSSYAASANTNNSNIHKEKIYDSIANKSRQGTAPVTNGFYTTSNTKSSKSSNQTHPYRKESSQTRPDDAQYDHWSSDRIKRGSSKPSGSSSSSNNNRAPAALPLSAVLNGYSLQRSQTHSHITTHSLERDSRADARRVSQDANPAPRVRTRRGGSLERLLDDHNSHNQHQYFHHHHHHHHHNGSVARHHHHHSRESSNDTSSTAPLHSYHSSADWSVGASHAPSSTSLTSTSSSTNNWNAAPPSMPSKNNAAGGSMATFSQRFQHQPQKGTPQYPPQQAARKSSHQSSSPTKSGSNPATGGSFVTNLGPNTSHKSSSAAVKYNMVTGNTSGSSAEVSPRRSSTEARHSSSMGVRSGNGSACATSSAAPVDNRLLMSSYAWIRGGEDTSSNNGDGGYHSSNANFGMPAGAAPLPPPPTVPVPPENEEAGVTGGGSSGEGVAGGTSGNRGHKKSRRRDARRHTLQNGLDYAVVRRAGELEAERDMLHQGLQVVEQARQWYRTQLHNLLYNLHHNTHSVQPYDSEAQQQKLHYQLARITEINSQLTALMSASDMPHHLALASSTGAAPTGSLLPAADASADKQDKSKMQGQVKRLKDQNHQLTEEVSMKSQHISVLEQDKSRLLRELFQARTVSAGSLESNGQADSTFM